MKRGKRIAVGLVAALTVAMSGLMPVSADEIRYGDINNDGVVDMLDLIVFNKYLNGIYDLYNYEVADVNCNCIVDTVDAEILSDYLTLLIKKLPYIRNTI